MPYSWYSRFCICIPWTLESRKFMLARSFFWCLNHCLEWWHVAICIGGTTWEPRFRLELHWMNLKFPPNFHIQRCFCEMFQRIFASAARTKWYHVSPNSTTINRILHFNFFMDAASSCFSPKTQEDLNLQSHCGHQWCGSARLRCGQHLRLGHLSYVEPAAYPGIGRLTSQQAWAWVATGGTTCDTWILGYLRICQKGWWKRMETGGAILNSTLIWQQLWWYFARTPCQPHFLFQIQYCIFCEPFGTTTLQSRLRMLQTLHGFLDQYFKCHYCRKHFLRQYEEASYGRDEAMKSYEERCWTAGESVNPMDSPGNYVSKAL